MAGIPTALPGCLVGVGRRIRPTFGEYLRVRNRLESRIAAHKGPFGYLEGQPDHLLYRSCADVRRGVLSGSHDPGLTSEVEENSYLWQADLEWK